MFITDGRTEVVKIKKYQNNLIKEQITKNKGRLASKKANIARTTSTFLTPKHQTRAAI